MADDILGEYLRTIDPARGAAVRLLDTTIRGAAPELTSRIGYKMLTYVFGKDLRHWVIAVDVTTKAVCLRFLYGGFMDDPARVLRHGTSTLSTIDYRSLDDVDAELVAAYAREAAANHAAFKLRAAEARG
ncbi:MAG TPA: DUF1801 domain-containing protein [Tepidiformaceae bacterium]|nr:DUF1801 domain-containing protein [Tepidiformaceae bacterium]